MTKIFSKTITLLVAALMLRLSLSFVAHHGDMNNNISWGTIAYEQGLNGFYGSSDADDWPYSAPNQPPLTILMFTGMRFVWQVVEDVSWWLNDNFRIFPSGFIWFWEAKGNVLMAKLPGMLADLAIGWIIFKFLLRKTRNKKKSLIVLSIWLFNPVTWYNSSVWGQTDSIVNLLGLISVLALLEKRLERFLIFFTLSLLFKGSLGIFIPVLGVIVLVQKHPLEKWLRALLLSFLITVATSVWFHPQLDLPFWLISLYKNRILPGEIGYLTANAFNFWWLVDPGKVYDSVIFMGISARNWGILTTLFLISAVLFWMRGKSSNKRVFAALAVVALVSFMFMTRIHERYMYPFFPYATLLLGLAPGLYLIYAIMSIIHLLNLYHLFWIPPCTFLEGLYEYSVFAQLLSFSGIFAMCILLRQLKRTKI